MACQQQKSKFGCGTPFTRIFAAVPVVRSLPTAYILYSQYRHSHMGLSKASKSRLRAWRSLFVDHSRGIDAMLVGLMGWTLPVDSICTHPDFPFPLPDHDKPCSVRLTFTWVLPSLNSVLCKVFLLLFTSEFAMLPETVRASEYQSATRSDPFGFR